MLIKRQLEEAYSHSWTSSEPISGEAITALDRGAITGLNE